VNVTPQKDQGTVLLTTLLIMTVMAAIIVALMEDIQMAVKRTLNVQAYSQADWQADGAEDFVTAYLKNDFRALAPVAKAALFQSRTPLVLPTREGAITLTLKDASQCFNLNAVVNNQGSRDDTAILEFGVLAQLLGLPENQAAALSGALIDWQDPNQQQSADGAEDGTYLRKNPPYRTADTSLRSPEEMRALHGMDEDLWILFKPFVCTGEAGNMPKVNVNSLTRDRIIILAAALSQSIRESEAISTAELILRDKPLEGYFDLEQIQQVIEASSNVQGVNLDRLGVDVSSVFVEAITQVGPAERIRTYRYDGVDSDAPTLTYRGWGRETFRPEIESQIESETEVDAR